MPDQNRSDASGYPLRLILLASLVSVLAAVGGMALLLNIFERRQEARNPFFRVVELTDETEDPAVWGMNFPLQYDAYQRTVDQVRTRYGGSEAMPRTPTDADPRSVVAQSKLEEDPRLRTMWAGYAFSVKSVGMRSCSTTRPSPGGSRHPLSPAAAFIATHPPTCPTVGLVKGT